MTIFEEMLSKDPVKNPIATAITTLKTTNEIQEFMKGYEDYLVQHGDTPDVRKDGVAIARKNVGYFLGYYPQEVAYKWMNALTEVSHPIFGYGFGRGRAPTSEEAYKIGKKAQIGV